ncbi:MAG: CPBP family intramembrane metalloprotease [Chloroflexi bacterium]|nr:CPBP family intramembrane metalloprotease [Chloroflexota bacterium]
MHGHDSEDRTPAAGTGGGVGTPDLTTPSSSDVRLPRVGQTWVGGRIAVIVAVLGLVGAALGGGVVAVVAQSGPSMDAILTAGITLVAIALLVGGLLLTAGGLGYYVLAPGFMGRAMAARGFGSHRLVIACTLLIALLANGPPLLWAAWAGRAGICTPAGLVTAALSVDAALLGVTYLRFIRPGVLTLADLGLDRTATVRHVGLGLLVGVSVLVISAMIQAAMSALGIRQTQLADLSCIRQFPLLGFFGVVFAGAILAPIAEEIYFRGYVFGSYLRTQRPVVAYAATGLIFAALHGNLPALLPILALSVVFCYAYQRTGSLVPSMVGHALNNTAAFCILYFTNAQV